MDGFLLSLDDLRLTDASRAGRKAAALGTLKAAGFLVPAGVCLLSAAFDLAMEPYSADLRQALSGLEAGSLESAEAAAGQIADLLNDLDVPAAVWDELNERLGDFGVETPLAVRSSAVAEDLESASFAGQYATLLGVPGGLAVKAAVLECWKSYFRAGALLERVRLNISEATGMALLIQPLLPAECAGVTFSIDPVRPESQRVMVSAAWGLGSGVVDGTVAADTWWLERRWQPVDECRIAHKTEQIVLDPLSGLRTIPVPAALQDKASLPDAWLVRVAQQALAAEAILGCPQDVEWAVADQQLWLLQSRPVASLGPDACPPEPFEVTWESADDRSRLWSLEPWGETGDQVPLPLELDDYRRGEEIRNDTCRMLGAERNQKSMAVNGRLYSTPMPNGLTAADMRVRRAAHDALQKRLYVQNQTTWDYYGPEIIEAVRHLASFQPPEPAEPGAGERIAEHLEEAVAVRRRHKMLHPMIVFRPARGFFEAFEALSGLSGTAAETAAYQLIDNEENILSRMIDAIYELSQAAKLVGGLPELLANPADDVLQRIAVLPDAHGFLDLLQAFLDQYGERNGDGYGSERTLLTPTWRERPQDVLRLAAPFLDHRLPSPAERRRAARDARRQHLTALCHDADPQAAAEFQRQLAYAGRLSLSLEEHNHYIDQFAFGQLRRAVLLAEGWLVEQGWLAPGGVFWLTFDEILAALRGQPPGDLNQQVAQRKAEYAHWLTLNPPPILGLPNFQLPPRPPPETPGTASQPQPADATPRLISGLGASAGRARGRVHLAVGSTEVPAVSPGDVLVAVNAGPLWSPVFSLLGALVLDSGSLAQHAASTAREYGIPAVIATGDATRRLKPGDWVTVDGALGTVQIDEA